MQNFTHFIGAIRLSPSDVLALSIFCTGCALLLLGYRLYVIIDCMRRDPAEFPAAVDRAVWVGLAALVPLGIGAYLYHCVFRREPKQWLFIVPLGCQLLVSGFLFLQVKSKLNFDFLFW
jgi:hypothetical protein